ncbi:hypothetical protein CMQ_6757 [Grosmannia clavigera kw1407]|uniref:3'-5' exonuclease domain-containing protein n=1 Tax=Grosmannia clavigera (strain kw1407 / UAMH 11150) TaxID=655863 RepID=F0X7M2_GROCL|nr:uncharacterized protein CMQ_6757 [Grosmannia clavigera kw1407]EFX06436.1 hypothetical protein CMQ_6757 [Grosmannia clavigera kw1407]
MMIGHLALLKKAQITSKRSKRLSPLLRETHLNKVIESGLVDTLSTVSVLVDTLYAQPTTPPSLYIDLEGVYLFREGTVSILQVYVLPLGRAYLLDVHTLKDAAFLTPGTNGRTLKDLLESSAIPKVFFDVRNDSDALFFHFKINLAGVQDLQLMELASRTHSRKYVAGLAKCIDRDGNLSPAKGAKWKATKEKGLKMFMPESGGSYEVGSTNVPCRKR